MGNILGLYRKYTIWALSWALSWAFEKSTIGQKLSIIYLPLIVVHLQYMTLYLHWFCIVSIAFVKYPYLQETVVPWLPWHPSPLNMEGSEHWCLLLWSREAASARIQGLQYYSESVVHSFQGKVLPSPYSPHTSPTPTQAQTTTIKYQGENFS